MLVVRQCRDGYGTIPSVKILGREERVCALVMIGDLGGTRIGVERSCGE